MSGYSPACTVDAIAVAIIEAPSVHTLKKNASTIIALTLLAAAADVSIFHRADIAKHLQAAVAIIPPRLFELAVALLAGLALLGLLIILRRMGSNVASFVHYLWAAPQESYDGLKPEERIKFENDLRANRIQVITTVVQALGGMAVLIGIYFAWANLKTTQEAQKDSQKNQTDALQITQEGQITDRFTKAIDQLGATDDKGNPRLELRLGGIYALERIAQKSEKDHWPIMEVLTTYVRVHAPAKKTDDKLSGSDGANARSNNANPRVSVPIAEPSPDIQAILTVISRRELKFEKGKDEHLNLTQTNLQGADLTGADLTGADLDGARLNEAHLNGARLNSAYLNSAYLVVADLRGAHLEGADLTGAHLIDTHLEGADLRGAHLEGADLTGAYLNGADLIVADLTGARLNRAYLNSAYLNGAYLEGAHLKSSIGLTHSQVNSALGDKDTELPPGIVMPESWKHPTAAPTAGAPKSP